MASDEREAFDDEGGGGRVQNTKPRLSQHEANILAQIAASIRSDSASPPPPKPGWSSAPALIGITVGLISIIGAAAAVLQGYTQLGDRVQSFGERMLANDARLSILERSFQERSQKRDGEVASLDSSNKLQDVRMQNFAVALEQERAARNESEADLRKGQAENRAKADDQAKTLSEIRSDLKVLVDRDHRAHAGGSPPDREAQVMQGR